MATRTSWKGYLKLSLVSCTVALYPACATSEKVSFHMLNARTGNRLKQQYVDAETGEVVEKEERAKGYEVAKDEHVVVSDEELANVRIESSHNVDIEKFVARSAVDPVFHDGHYYMVPDDQVGQEAFAVIRGAMAKRGVVGIARVVLFGKERTVMLEPRGRGILLTTLRYAYEAKDENAYFDDIPSIKPSRQTLEMAVDIVDAKFGDFDPEEYGDRYLEAVVELIRSKSLGDGAPKAKRASKDKRASRRKDLSLADALRKSLSPPKAKAVPRGANGGVPKAGPVASTRPPLVRPVLARAMPGAAAARKSRDAQGKPVMARR